MEVIARHLRALARRWPVLAGLVLASTALGALFASCGTASHTARVRLLLRQNPFTLSPPDFPAPLPSAWSRGASPALLLSDATLERAVREGLRDLFPPGSPEDLAAAVQSLRTALSARAEDEGNLIVLSCTEDSPARAVAIANAVARAFGAAAVERQKREVENAVSFLDQAIQDREHERSRAMKEIDALAPPPAEPGFERIDMALLEEAGSLERSLSSARLESASLAVEIDLLMDRADHAEFGPIPPAETAESDRLGRDLEAARRELDHLRAARPEDGPGIAAAADRADRLRRQRAETADRELARSQFAPVRSLLDQLREKAARRERLLSSTRDTQIQLDKARQRLQEHRTPRYQEIQAESRERNDRRRQLERDLARVESSIQELKARRAQVSAAKATLAPPADRIEPAGAAVASATTTYRRLPLWALLGLALGIGAALALGRAGAALHTEADVHRIVNLPLLGVVPRVEGEEPVLVRAAPTTALSETWQSIAVVFESLARKAGVKTILVTSPGAGEGKSSAACNLAMALARAGARTLLMDADLRRPTQHQIFALPAEWSAAGLSAFLQQTLETVDPAIAPTGIENLGLLPAGPCPGPTAPFLRSERFGAMVEGLREKHEFVVVDGPPVAGAPDSLLLAPRVDAVLMVLSAGETQKDEATEAKRLLAAAGGELIGCVLNKSTARSRGYYSYSPYSFAEAEE